MRHIFIINPCSFRTQAALDAVIFEIGQCFKNRNETDYFIHISRFPRDAVGKIHELAAKDEKVRVYAIGGDGILFDCINGIAVFPSAELVPVPYGKTNDYVRAFGEGKNELFRNINGLVNEEITIPTDLMYYGNNYAINDCTIGIESTAIIRMYTLKKKYRKYIDKYPFVYSFLFFASGFISLFDQKLLYQHYDIMIDGEDYSGHYSTINIANGPCYGGNMCAAPTAVPDDGYLDVQLYKSQGTLALTRSIQSYLYGKRPLKNIVFKRAKKISIRSGKSLLIQLDGEILIDTNITLEVVPKAIKMVAPEGIRYERRLPYDT
jgi:YegS/Rv2252/BmrU family lipid kinase